MCCCYVKKCCCGCITIRSGVYFMAIIDLFANCIVCMLVGVMIGVYGYRTIPGFLSGLVFLVLLANLLLICGLGVSCNILVALWQIMMFIYILLLIVGWILIPFIFVIDFHPLVVYGIVDQGPKLDINIKVDLPSLNYIQWGAIMLGFLILPIYYTYFWIVVNSYRKSLNRRRKRSDRLTTDKENDTLFVRNAPSFISHQYANPTYDQGNFPTNLYGEELINAQSTYQSPYQWVL